MKELGQLVIEYFQQNLLASLIIAFVAGFSANKTVAYERKGNLILHAIVGLFGFFLGQYAILLFGLKEIIDQLAAFRLFFDFIAAYIGAFILASIIHFMRPV